MKHAYYRVEYRGVPCALLICTHEGNPTLISDYVPDVTQLLPRDLIGKGFRVQRIEEATFEALSQRGLPLITVDERPERQ